MSTADERATWKALAEAGGLMPGPWEAKMIQPDMGGLHQYRIGNPRRPTPLNSVRLRADDAEFIAAARTALPALLADVDRLERELAHVRALLEPRRIRDAVSGDMSELHPFHIKASALREALSQEGR